MCLRDLSTNVIKLCVIGLLAILCLTTPIVQAEFSYLIPTFGASWVTRMIDVSIPSQPAIAYGLVVRAVEIWNEAQLWFRSTYLHNGNVYTFVLGKQKPGVLVEFTDYWTVSNYCPSFPLGVAGCTHVRWNDSWNITLALVYLDTNTLTQQGQLNDSIFLVLHEVGHALGLRDLPSSSSSPCPIQDLMCLYHADEYPSTLDLYALHELAGRNREADVLLPSNIPYSYYVPPMSMNRPLSGFSSMAVTSQATGTPSPPSYVSNWSTVIVLAPIVALGTAIFLLISAKSKRRRFTEESMV
jgi:hypothetical protein